MRIKHKDYSYSQDNKVKTYTMTGRGLFYILYCIDLLQKFELVFNVFKLKNSINDDNNNYTSTTATSNFNSKYQKFCSQQ